MTEHQQSILTKQIKGLTWGVVLAIIGAFGSGAVYVVNGYVKIEKALTRYDNAIEDDRSAIKVVNLRVDRQEDKLFLVSQKLNQK